MGWQVSRRPILSPGLQVIDPDGTVGANDPAGVSGDAVIADDLTVSGKLDVTVESLTGTAAAQTLSADGISILTYATSNLSNDFLLPAPTAGAIKTILVTNNTTSVELTVFAAATAAANVFWGTTFNEAGISAASTGSPGGTPSGTARLDLVGVSTAQWSLSAGSSFSWDLAGSTGSTAQA